MHSEDSMLIPLRAAASLACRKLGMAGEAGADALDAAAEAISRLMTIHHETSGRLDEVPLEDRMLGAFEGGAARFVARGAVYRRLCVRRADLAAALAALGEGSAVPAMAEEERPRHHGPRRP